MTQVQLTDQQLNRALTELMGYSVKRTGEYPDRYRMVNPKGEEFGVWHLTEGLVWNEYAYPYCTDEVASHKLLEKAIEMRGYRYAETLSDIVAEREDRRRQEHYPYGLITVCLLASPRERAEAAYITLQRSNEQ